MNTRRFPRSLLEAFGTDASSACAIEKPETAGEKMAGIVLAVVIGIAGAAALVHWWSA